MKLKLLLWLFMFVASLFAQETVKDKIMKYCKGKWATDYSMVEYEYKKQLDALKELQEFKNKAKEMGAERETGNMIKRASSKYWKKDYDIPDFSMVIYECKTQFIAVIKISKYYNKYKDGSVEHIMLNHAVGKWREPDFDTYNYIMIVYEFEKQLKAFYKTKK